MRTICNHWKDKERDLVREKAWSQEVSFGSENYPVIAIPILFLVFDAGKGNVTSLYMMRWIKKCA